VTRHGSVKIPSFYRGSLEASRQLVICFDYPRSFACECEPRTYSFCPDVFLISFAREGSSWLETNMSLLPKAATRRKMIENFISDSVSRREQEAKG
jgi:hypothetical protein